MSDTPRTDAAIWNREDRSWMDGSLCRKLESELAAVTKERDIEVERATHYRDKLQEALARIKRLEEAGDAMAFYAHKGDRENWEEAKEAQP